MFTSASLPRLPPALGYVSDAGLHDLPLVLRLVVRGGFGCCSATARELMTRLGVETTLSSREIVIAAEVAAGRTNTEIANTLSIKTSTIDTYVERMLRKIGGRTRLDIATWYQRQAGLHDDADSDELMTGHQSASAPRDQPRSSID